MSLPERPILEQCFTQANWPDAVVTAIELVGIQKGRHLLAKSLAEAWVRENGTDRYGVGLWIRQQMMKQAGNA